MGLLSLFKRQSPPPAEPAPTPDAVSAARTRARRRLIGATVLLGLGIVGFPLLFETQPRPIPVDIPIEVPRKDSLPPLAMPAPMASAPGAVVADGAPADAPRPPAAEAGASGVRPPAPAAAEIVERPDEQGRERQPAAAASAARAGAAAAVVAAAPVVAAVAAAAGASRPAAASAHEAAPKPAPADPAAAKPAASKAAAPAAKPASGASKPAAKPASAASKPAAAKTDNAEAARARALLEGRTPAASAPTAGSARVVVQVGAFTDADKLREARHKVEKLGFKTYTQVVDTDGGKRTRVRVGPFASKAEADKAAARLKGAGLPAAILTL